MASDDEHIHDAAAPQAIAASFQTALSPLIKPVSSEELLAPDATPLASDMVPTASVIQASSGILDTRSSRARRWTRLNAITVRNFKAIKEATIPLGNVTILVGPNGSGKSSALQAIHWAARAASYIMPKNTKEMISFERLDYIPSSEPLKTAHKGDLRSETSSAATEIVFEHGQQGEDLFQATVKIRAARNKGGITASMEGGNAVTPYKQRVQFITSYIPGLAGLSEKESILAQPSLRRQAASGDAGGVLRNVLL